MEEQYTPAGERCRDIFWKGLAVDPFSDISTAEHLWCLRTQRALGPDGKPVDKYECNPARPCYKAL